MKEMFSKKAIASFAIMAMVALVSVSGAGCLGDDDGDDSLGTIKLGYVLWEGEIASTNVLALVLEEAGYDVDMISMDAGILYQSLADGTVDLTTSAWLPATQGNYWDTYGDDIVTLGPNLEGCYIGLAVPQYLEDINSLWDLQNNSGMFDSTIVGIDPGAGMMTNTETAMETYGLDDWELASSSSAGMLAELTSAYDDEEPIVVTLWTPHWAFMEMDLKLLDDPEGDFGDAERVETLTREGFADDMPEANAIADRFYWDLDEIQEVMFDIQQGTSEEEAAQAWIDDNQETVDYWLSGDDGDQQTTGELTFGYVLWEGEIASTNVLTLVLEEAGYDVNMVSMDAGVLYQSLADGSVDFTTSAWLPVTQGNYWDVYGDDIDDSLGTNLEGCYIGLAVPQYLEDINSLWDLQNNSGMFDSTIVGIDPGAGMMTNTEMAMETYGLDDWTLQTSSSAAMLAALTSAYDDEEPIVVTLWTPHWAFNKMDLKLLDDPAGDFGEADDVYTLARQGFVDDRPDVAEILERFNWTQADISSVMLDIQEGTPEEEAAQDWIDANRETVDYWLTGE